MQFPTTELGQYPGHVARAAAVPEEHEASDASGARVLRRTFAGALGDGTAAHRARDAAIREIWPNLANDPEPAVAPLRGVEFFGLDVTLVYDSFDGSLADQLEATRVRSDVALPLGTLTSLRSVLVAASCAVASHEAHGLELRRAALSPKDVIVRGDVPYLRMSAFETPNPSHPVDVSVASFGGLLTLCLTGASSAPSTLGSMRTGLPEVFSNAAHLLSSAPPGTASLADRCSRTRSEIRRFVGRLATANVYPKESPYELMRWQLGLLGSLRRLGARGLVNRYFDGRATGAGSAADFQLARRLWDTFRSLPQQSPSPTLPSPKRSSAARDVAHAYLARAGQAFEESDMATALVAWRCAATAAPGSPHVWLEFARLWAEAGCASAEAFGLAEAFCVVRGESAMLRTLLGRIDGCSVSDLSAYFERTGHGAVATWLRFKYG